LTYSNCGDGNIPYITNDQYNKISFPLSIGQLGYQNSKEKFDDSIVVNYIYAMLEKDDSVSEGGITGF